MLLCAPLRKSKATHSTSRGKSKSQHNYMLQVPRGKSIWGYLGEPGECVSSTGYNRKGNREGDILNLGSVHKPNREGGILNLGSVYKPNREEGKDFYAIANVLAPPEQRTSG